MQTVPVISTGSLAAALCLSIGCASGGGAIPAPAAGPLRWTLTSGEAVGEPEAEMAIFFAAQALRGGLYAAATPCRGGTGSVIRVDTRTGRILWRRELPMHSGAEGGSGTWAFAKKYGPGEPSHMVLFRYPERLNQSSDAPMLLAMDEQTGAELWRSAAGPGCTSAIFNEGRVIALTLARRGFNDIELNLVAMAPKDGQVLWRHNIGKACLACLRYPLIYAANKSTIVLTRPGSEVLAVFRATDGQHLGDLKYADSLHIALQHDRIVVPCSEKVRILKAVHGLPLLTELPLPYRFCRPRYATGHRADSSRDGLTAELAVFPDVESAAVGADTVLFAGVAQPHSTQALQTVVTCIDAQAGRVNWSDLRPFHPGQRPRLISVSEDEVVVSHGWVNVPENRDEPLAHLFAVDVLLTCYNIGTGRSLWNQRIGVMPYIDWPVFTPGGLAALRDDVCLGKHHYQLSYRDGHRWPTSERMVMSPCLTTTVAVRQAGGGRFFLTHAPPEDPLDDVFSVVFGHLEGQLIRGAARGVYYMTRGYLSGIVLPHEQGQSK